MELRDAVRRRRMVRAFDGRPVSPELVDSLLDLGRRAPAAGNTAEARSFLVLEGAQTARYWDVTFPAARRESFRWPHLIDAPVLVIALVRAAAYVERYAEPDKARTGLGEGEDRWPVPYWWVDGGMAVEAILLGAVDAGLGALFFGIFDHEHELLAELGVPDGWRALGTIALGWARSDEPSPSPSPSLARPRPGVDEVVHRGRW
jgi:nitroreductase